MSEPFYRFTTCEEGSQRRQARVQTLEPNSWMKEVITVFLVKIISRFPLSSISWIQENALNFLCIKAFFSKFQLFLDSTTK